MEAIHEETTTNTRVTPNAPTTKPETEKNPGRVAAGKAMAERNHKIRDAKKQAATAATTAAQTANTPPPVNQNSEESQSTNNMNGIYILSIGGFILSLIGLYYKRKEVLAVINGQKKNEITSDCQERPSDVPLTPPKSRPQKSNTIPMV